MAYLKVSGTKIVDQNGEEIILRGAGLGGWMKCAFILLSFRVMTDSFASFPLQHGELHQRSVDITGRRDDKSTELVFRVPRL